MCVCFSNIAEHHIITRTIKPIVFSHLCIQSFLIAIWMILHNTPRILSSEPLINYTQSHKMTILPRSSTLIPEGSPLFFPVFVVSFGIEFSFFDLIQFDLFTPFWFWCLIWVMLQCMSAFQFFMFWVCGVLSWMIIKITFFLVLGVWGFDQNDHKNSVFPCFSWILDLFSEFWCLVRVMLHVCTHKFGVYFLDKGIRMRYFKLQGRGTP